MLSFLGFGVSSGAMYVKLRVGNEITNKQRKKNLRQAAASAVTSTSQCNSSHHQAQTGQSNGGFGVVKPERSAFLFFLMGI